MVEWSWLQQLASNEENFPKPSTGLLDEANCSTENPFNQPTLCCVKLTKAKETIWHTNMWLLYHALFISFTWDLMLMSPYKTQSNFLKSHSLKLFLPLKNLLAVCTYKIRKKSSIPPSFKREEPGDSYKQIKEKSSFSGVNISVSNLWGSPGIFEASKGLGSSTTSQVRPHTAHTAHLKFRMSPLNIWDCGSHVSAPAQPMR